MKKLISVFLIYAFLFSNSAGFAQSVPNSKAPIVDDFAEKTLHKQNVEVNTPYAPQKVIDAKFDNLTMAVSIEDYVTTRNKLFEGQELNFKVMKDVTKNGVVIIPRGTKVVGRVELITMNGAFGTPADLTVGNFVLKGGPNGVVGSEKLEGEIVKKGASRSYWVWPVGAISLLLLVFPGLLVLTIRGGHAKIKPNQHYALKYLHPVNL